MEVLLRTTIEKLGTLGDVVKVAPGYARNYLLPRGLAIQVNEANLAEIERERKRAMVLEQSRMADLKTKAEGLRNASVTIEGRANDEGHLFGSVNAAQISAALSEKGFPVEDKQVRLDNPIKEIGVYDVPVHLHADVDTTIKVWVVQAKPE